MLSPAVCRPSISLRTLPSIGNFLLLPQETLNAVDSSPAVRNTFHLSSWRASSHLMTLASSDIAVLRCPGSSKNPPGSVADQSTTPYPALVDAHRLLASLVLHRVRPPNRLRADTGPRRPSRSDLESLGKRRSVQPVTTAQAASAGPVPSVDRNIVHRPGAAPPP